MNARSHLVATPIVDAKGKQTTVYRRPEAQPGGAASKVPAPVVSGAAPVKESGAAARKDAYAQRLAAIAADNDAWGPSHPKYHEVLGWANEGLSTLTRSIANGRRGQAEGLARYIGEAYEQQAYSRAVAADLLGGIYGGMFSATEKVDVTDIDQLDSWQFGVKDDCVWYNGVFKVTTALNDLGLLALSQVPDDPGVLSNKEPEERDFRFMTHLLACAKGFLEYAEPEKHGDYIRLLDEYPERLDDIAAAAQDGRHAAAARSLIESTAHGAVASGAL